MLKVREGFLLGLAPEPERSSPCAGCIQMWLIDREVAVERVELSELTVRRELIPELLSENSCHIFYEIDLDGTYTRLEALVYPHPNCSCEKTHYLPPQEITKRTNFAFSPLTQIKVARFGTPDGNLWLASATGEAPLSEKTFTCYGVDKDKEVARFKAVDEWMKRCVVMDLPERLKRGETIPAEVLQTGNVELITRGLPQQSLFEGMGGGANKEEATLNALFGLEYKRYGEEHKEIYETETSERSFEEETKLSGFSAAPVKNEGGAISYDNAQEAFTARYTHETIALGFSITEEAIEDNLYDSLSARYTKALARAMAYTKQVKAAAVLNNGFSSSYAGGDGQALFSTAHPLVSGGTNSNTPSTQVDLNETSLEAAVIQIAAWTDERGLLIAARPKKMIVPPALMFVADRLLETELRVGTNDNDINAIKNMGAVPEGYTVNHFLTDTNAWFLTTDVPNGMKHFVRTPLQNSMDGDFDTGNVRYKARERYSFGWSDPLGMWGSSGSS